MERSLLLSESPSYIQLDGSHYFKLDKSYSDIKGGKIVMDFSVESPITSSTTLFILSSRVSSSVNSDRSLLINQGVFRNDVRGSRIKGPSTVVNGARYIIEQENNTCKVYSKDNGVNTYLYTITSSPSSTSYSTNPFLIAASYNSNTEIDARRLIGKFYSLIMYDNASNLVRCYLPSSSNKLRDAISGNEFVMI